MITKSYHSLEDIQYNIDLIDKVIIQLISERSFFVDEATRFINEKQEDADRLKIEKIIERVRYLAISKNLNPDVAEKIYRTMMEAFVEQTEGRC